MGPVVNVSSLLGDASSPISRTTMKSAPNVDKQNSSATTLLHSSIPVILNTDWVLRSGFIDSMSAVLLQATFVLNMSRTAQCHGRRAERYEPRTQAQQTHVSQRTSAPTED